MPELIGQSPPAPCLKNARKETIRSLDEFKLEIKTFLHFVSDNVIYLLPDAHGPVSCSANLELNILAPNSKNIKVKASLHEIKIAHI